MTTYTNVSHPSPRSTGVLSSLGELNGFNFGRTSMTDTPRDPHNAQDNDSDVDTHETPYASPDPHEIRGLVVDAANNTSRLITVRVSIAISCFLFHQPLPKFFIETSAMLHTPEIAKNAIVCTAVHNCLETIPERTVLPTQYMAPKGSSWRAKRRTMEVSLLK